MSPPGPFHGFAVVCLALLGMPNLADSAVVELVVGPMPAPDPSSVSVSLSAGPLGQSTATSPLSGTITLQVEPSLELPETAQITDLNLIVDEAVEFRLASGLVQASSDSKALGLQMIESAPPGDVVGGSFDQLGTLLGLVGFVSVSTAAEPVDLGLQPPASVDIRGLSLARQDSSLTLETQFGAQAIVPVRVGLLGNVDVIVDITGAIHAVGQASSGAYRWQPELIEPVHQWGDSDDWLRDSARSTTPPGSSDSVFLEASVVLDSPIVLDLEGPRSVGSATFMSDFRLTNGELSLTDSQLAVNSLLAIDDGASLTAASEVFVTGDGAIVVDGSLTRTRIGPGIAIGGRGEMESLHVETGARLLGLLDNRVGAGKPPLEIIGDLVIDGDFQVVTELSGLVGPGYVDPQNGGERHRRLLVIADSVSIDELDSVMYEETSLAEQGAGLFTTHAGGGLYRLISFTGESIVLENYQARAGDANGDDQVNFADFLALSNAFGGPGDWTQGDFDQDGNVSFADFLLLSDNLENNPVANVPSPHGTPLLIGGMLLVWIRIASAHKKRGLRRANAAWQAGRSGARQPSR